MEFNITVPDKIVLKGELSERSISLENCHNQDEIIDYLNSYIAILHNPSLEHNRSNENEIMKFFNAQEDK